MKRLLTWLVLAVLLRGVATGQPSPPLAMTNGPVQVYYDAHFGTLTVQPMICNGKPYGELSLSNSLGQYMKHDRAVVDTNGVVVGYEVNSFLPDALHTRVTTLTWTNDFEFSTNLVDWVKPSVFFVRRAAITTKTQ